MQLIPYRMLRNQPGEVRRLLEQEGELVVTSNNEPFALLLDIEADGLEDVLLLVSRIRAQRAVSAIREKARERGLDRLTEEGIEAEVKAARAARHQASC